MANRLMIVIWSFVLGLLISQLIEGNCNALFTITLVFMTLFMWIYTLVGIIKTEFPTKLNVTVNIPKEPENTNNVK